ncbi:MAG: GlsB/YeaQ/YmgE family stress response membrane protein [Methylovirgula sp.]
MHGDSLLIIVIVGIVAGWLAGQIVRGTGFGLIADLCIGVIGAFIGNWLLPELGVHLGFSRIIDLIISATIGAIALLIILGLFRRRRW